MKDEDEALEDEFKKLNSGTDICEDLNKAYSILQGDNGGVSSALEDALSYVNDAYKYDEGLLNLKDSLYELDSLCKDLTRDLYQKLEDVSVDEERLTEVSNRLDEINHLKMKYGNTYESIMNYLSEKKEKLDFYLDYDNRLKEHEEKIENCKSEIISLCDKLTDIRTKTAKELKKKITDVLLELNFLDVKFDIAVNKKDDFNAKGNNEVIFMISVLIPTYNYVCYKLVRDLQCQLGACGGEYEIIVAEDGSDNQETIRENDKVTMLPGCVHLVRKENIGRAHIINYLVREAKGEWWTVTLRSSAMIISVNIPSVWLTARMSLWEICLTLIVCLRQMPPCGTSMRRLLSVSERRSSEIDILLSVSALSTSWRGEILCLRSRLTSVVRSMVTRTHSWGWN